MQTKLYMNIIKIKIKITKGVKYWAGDKGCGSYRGRLTSVTKRYTGGSRRRHRE
jgi:hypothetical protein